MNPESDNDDMDYDQHHADLRDGGGDDDDDDDGGGDEKEDDDEGCGEW